MCKERVCCARKETVDIDILETSMNGDRKIIITSRPPLRKTKWNQFTVFRQTSTKIIPIETIMLATFRQ